MRIQLAERGRRIFSDIFGVGGIIVLAGVVEAGCASAPATRSFLDLPLHVAAGNSLEITDAAGSVSKGKLLQISPTTLTLVTEDSQRRDFAARDVQRIRRAERRVGRATLIGVATGAATGLLVGAAKHDAETAVIGFFGGAFWGAINGLIAGGLVRVHPTIYEGHQLSGSPEVPGSPDLSGARGLPGSAGGDP